MRSPASSFTAAAIRRAAAPPVMPTPANQIATAGIFLSVAVISTLLSQSELLISSRTMRVAGGMAATAAAATDRMISSHAGPDPDFQACRDNAASADIPAADTSVTVPSAA